jgi:asparagine synthase (glutamine-hydrolysing)
LLAKGEAAKLGNFKSLGLGGVVATQLWHHLYLGGGLCELPHREFPQAAEPTARPPSSLAVA